MLVGPFSVIVTTKGSFAALVQTTSSHSCVVCWAGDGEADGWEGQLGDDRQEVTWQQRVTMRQYAAHIGDSVPNTLGKYAISIQCKHWIMCRYVGTNEAPHPKDEI